MFLRDAKRKKHDYSRIREDRLKYINIPIYDEWYKKNKIQNKYIPKKPEWVKLKFHDGVPYLVAHCRNVWEIRPIQRKVYEIWINQMLEEKDHELPNRC